jgi:hypothetical protein
LGENRKRNQKDEYEIDLKNTAETKVTTTDIDLETLAVVCQDERIEARRKKLHGKMICKRKRIDNETKEAHAIILDLKALQRKQRYAAAKKTWLESENNWKRNQKDQNEIDLRNTAETQLTRTNVNMESPKVVCQDERIEAPRKRLNENALCKRQSIVKGKIGHKTKKNRDMLLQLQKMH